MHPYLISETMILAICCMHNKCIDLNGDLATTFFTQVGHIEGSDPSQHGSVECRFI